MHEASIAEGILRVAIGAMPRPNCRILRVTVVAGALSGVEAEPLSLWFEQLGKGTPAEGAELVLHRRQARLTCRSCGQGRDYDGAGPVDPRCAKCGSTVTLEGGDDLYVDSAEVE